MAYAVADDVTARYGAETVGQLTGSPRGTAIDDNRLQAALDDAHAEVDGYLAVRFPVVPLDPVPPGLKTVVCDIAVYRLLAMRPKGDIEDARNRYKDALALLEAIASSHKALAGAPVTGNIVKQSQPPRVFSDDRTRLYLGLLQ